MKVHTEFGQGSVDWMLARSGKPTASEFDALVTPKFEIKTGLGPATYLAKKLAEAWQGGPLPGFNSFDMDQGSLLEKEAKPWYEIMFEEKIETVGLITTDDGRIACSPDGLIGEYSGIEIKCPEAHTQVNYLLAGVVPPDYLAQVHGSLYVSGRSTWRFLSYRRNFPALVVTVQRDPAIMAKIDEALNLFLDRFDRGFQRLCELNGGPPKHKPVPTPPPVPVLDPEDASQFDIIP